MKGKLKTIFVAVAISLILLLSVGCNGNNDKELVKIGEVIINENKRDTIDGRLPIRTLPKGTTKIKYLGYGWYSFELYGECFLLGEHHKRSVMSPLKECS